MFWLLIVVMLTAAVLNTAILMIVAAKPARADGAAPTSAGEP